MVGDIGEGGGAIGVEPGIVPGDVVDDDGGGGRVPGGTLIDGSVVLGIADGEMPPADTGSEYGDSSAAGLPGFGTDPGECTVPGLPRLGTDPGDCPKPGAIFGTDPGDCGRGGRPVCANAAVAGMTRTKAASVHTYFIGLHIRNRGATMPR